jgi:hypothetical protein
MRLSILILSLVLPAAVAAAPSVRLPGPPARCPADRSIFTDGAGDSVRAKKLGELPPGRLYLSVDRRIGDCRQPVIVRYGIGATAAPRRQD